MNLPVAGRAGNAARDSWRHRGPSDPPNAPRFLLFLICLFASAGQLAIDIYVPALPAMAHWLAPIVAPVIGAHLQTWFGWRACLVFLLVYSFAMWALLWRYRETLRNRWINAQRIEVSGGMAI